MTDHELPASDLAAQSDTDAQTRLEQIMRQPKKKPSHKRPIQAPTWIKESPSPAPKPEQGRAKPRQTRAPESEDQRWKLAGKYAAAKIAEEMGDGAGQR